jgi:uncharacterized cysteine cluster protein YcgN (CxxCxxCC family)
MIHFSGEETKPELWGFVEYFLNQFIYVCKFKSSDSKLESKCLEMSKDLRKEFDWLPSLIIENLKLKLIQQAVI